MQRVQASKLSGRGGQDPGLAAPCAPATERSRSTVRAGLCCRAQWPQKPIGPSEISPTAHSSGHPSPLGLGLFGFPLASLWLPPVPLPLFGGLLITHCFWQVTLITEAPPSPQTNTNSPSKHSRRQQRNTAKPHPALALNGPPKSVGLDPRFWPARPRTRVQGSTNATQGSILPAYPRPSSLQPQTADRPNPPLRLETQ
jgi:hypothetical protein